VTAWYAGQEGTEKADWIGHILRGNHLLKYVIEGKVKGGMQVTERRGIRRKQLLNGRVLQIERGSTRSHPVENSLWKRLWPSRKKTTEMNE
jgi:hypothetical protein